MVELRTQSEVIVNSLRKRVQLILTYRGKSLAKISPFKRRKEFSGDDPIYRLNEYAVEGMGSLLNKEIDQILYGKP